MRANAQTTSGHLVRLELAGGNTFRMKSSLSKRLIAVAGLALLAAVAAWQFYLFVVFKGDNGTTDLQGGRVHLWIAIAIAVVTCVAAVFLISKLLSYDRQDEMHITSQGHPLGAGRTSEGRS